MTNSRRESAQAAERGGHISQNLHAHRIAKTAGAGWQHALQIAIGNSYPDLVRVSVSDARNKFPDLIRAVERGESVTICRRGAPVVDPVRTKTGSGQKPKFGAHKLRK